MVEPAKPANNSDSERQDAVCPQGEAVWQQEPLGGEGLFAGEPPKFLSSPEVPSLARLQRRPEAPLWPLVVYLFLIVVLITAIFLGVFAFG